ncbi:MAG: 1-acyl-sn-glycerol-3-phosphate acyltransferase [Acidimicrobiales bacterium]
MSTAKNDAWSSALSAKRQILMLLDKTIGRRVILTPAALLATTIGIVASPLIVVVTVSRDLILRRTRVPTLRLAALVVGALVIETVGMAVSFITWTFTGFGKLGSERWRWHLHRAYMGWYTRAMLTLITRVLSTEVTWRDHADLSSGPVVMVARHTSFFDAVIPATVLSQRNQLLAHHIVTHELRYSPCIDIVGHRFPNRFIKRTPGEGSAELGPIRDIGGLLDDRSAAIIFPEGTFRTPERFERAVRRIGRRQPDLAARASELAHVLPPRSNGTFALLQGAPTADLVVCTNTGFESFGSIKDIVTQPFTDKPIIVETWRIARADIPDDADAFSDWLFDQYVLIDEWVKAQDS